MDSSLNKGQQSPKGPFSGNGVVQDTTRPDFSSPDSGDPQANKPSASPAGRPSKSSTDSGNPKAM